MRKVFLDVESTGLDPINDKLIEVSWAVEKGPIKTNYLGVTEVPPFIDDLIGFTKRGLADIPATEDWEEFRQDTTDATLVAANPSFDANFLKVNDRFYFHYRMLDLESYAVGKLDLEDVPGMKTVYDMLTRSGYDLPEPDHTSMRDVDSLRAAYYILRYI